MTSAWTIIKVLAPTTLLLFPLLASAETQPPETAKEPNLAQTNFYHTPEERREAGLGTRLGAWLTIYGLVESEINSTDFSYRSVGANTGSDEFLTTAQLAFNAEFSDQLSGEIVFEFEEDNSESSLDEAFVEFQQDGWSFIVGRQSLPFGEFYSHFITGPFLEFGETVTSSFMIGYDFYDVTEVFIYTYAGDAKKINAEARVRDWGASLETKLLEERVVFGASYLSDLADSDEQLLEDNDNVYSKRVDAWSAYAVFRPWKWELSMEYLGATKAFIDLDVTANQPEAWNVELAYYPSEKIQLAARYETSKELSDAPELQYGLSATWSLENALLSLEYLRGEYKPNFAFDDDDNELQRRDWIAGRFSLEF